MDNPFLEMLKAWLDKDFDQSGLVEGIPVHGRGVESRWSLRPLKVLSIGNETLLMIKR